MQSQWKITKKTARIPIDVNGEKKKFLIYNPSNRLLTPQIVTQLLAKCQLRYHVNDITIFQKGLTHKSYVIITNPEIEYDEDNKCVPLQLESNEELEFMGDSVISLVVTAYLHQRYPTQNEGFLTKLKTKLVRTKMLAKFSLYLGLDKYLLISKHVEDFCHGRTNERILEDTFEAFIGSLYTDLYRNDSDRFGIATQYCFNLIIHIIEATTDFRDLTAINDNYKEILLQFYHRTFTNIHPTYQIVSTSGPTNRRIFTMGIYHPNDGKLLIGQGTARKKIQAEQIASFEAIKYFKQHTPPSRDGETLLDLVEIEDNSLAGCFQDIDKEDYDEEDESHFV